MVFTRLLNQRTPAPARNVKRSKNTPAISNAFFQNSNDSNDIEEPLGRILDIELLTLSAAAFVCILIVGTYGSTPGQYAHAHASMDMRVNPTPKARTPTSQTYFMG
jgi:hypothetical protein